MNKYAIQILAIPFNIPMTITNIFHWNYTFLGGNSFILFFKKQEMFKTWLITVSVFLWTSFRSSVLLVLVMPTFWWDNGMNPKNHTRSYILKRECIQYFIYDMVIFTQQNTHIFCYNEKYNLWFGTCGPLNPTKNNDTLIQILAVQRQNSDALVTVNVLHVDMLSILLNIVEFQV